MRPLSVNLAIAVAAAGVAIVSGCGGPASGAEHPPPAPVTPGMPMAPAAGSGTAPAPDAPVATTVVAIQNFAFSPATITIKAGSTVTWTNRDEDPHTVTALSGGMSGPFHSPVLNTGQSYRYTFTAPGRFDYLCTIHPFMTATVVVTP